MTLALPGGKIDVQDGGLGIVATPSQDVHVVMGCAAAGVLSQPYEVSTIDRLKSDYKAGPAVKAAAYSIAKTSASVVFVRLPASTRAAQIKDKVVSGSQTVTITGTPNEAYDIVIVCTTGGTIASAPGPSFKWSKDGGANFTTPVSQGAATTLTLTGTGLTATFTATNVFAVDDQVSAWTIPAAQSIGPVTTTRVGSSTSVVTFTGTPVDDYEPVWQPLTGGTVGVAGITYRYSLDGGRSWTTKKALGTANTVTLLDGDTESSGIVVNLAAGTLEANDTFEAKVFGPDWSAADALTAIDNLMGSSHSWRFLRFVGWKTKTDIASVASKVADIAAGAYCKHTFGLFDARPRGTFEKESSWEDRLITEFDSLADVRTGVGAGQARITCPMTGRQNRRPILFPVTARIVSKTIQVDPGRRLDGPLGSDVALYDDNKQRQEHDALVSRVLHGARFITLRTYTDRPGVFATRGNLMSAENSDFNRIAYRAVMDLATTIFNAVMLEQIENHLASNPTVGGDPGAVPGALSETACRRIDRELTTALRNVLVASGYAVSVSAVTSRTAPFLSTGKLTAKVRVLPFGYVDSYQGDIGFEGAGFNQGT